MITESKHSLGDGEVDPNAPGGNSIRIHSRGNADQAALLVYLQQIATEVIKQ